MSRKPSTSWGLVLTGVATALGLITSQPKAYATGPEVHQGHGNHDDDAHETKSGPHGGRLLESEAGLALEVTIFEPGIPPQSRIYPYVNGAAISPAQVKVVVELHRFSRVDTIQYRAQDDFLLGDLVVKEPHSFDVKVRATYQGQAQRWEYASYEGRTEISAKSAQLLGVGVETVQPRPLVERIPVLGQVGFNQDAVTHVSAPYSGTILSLSRRVGDSVKRGSAMGSIKGTQSLSTFFLRSLGPGRVVEKRVTVGEVIDGGRTMFVVADLSTVWVDFTVYRQDAARVAAGQPVRIMPGDGLGALRGTLAYLAPLGNAQNQSVTARAVIPNSSGKLRPGLFVKGEIEVRTVNCEATVRREAIQGFRDWQVVFRNRGTLYEIAIVELGIVDGDFVQVLSGLSPGERYVAKNSFIVKADINKSGASHDH